MILKFDHISLSCSSEVEAANSVPAHYTEVFREMELDNIPCKMKYLKLKSPKHNIIMLSPTTPNGVGIPIEITQYPEVLPLTKSLSFKNHTIFWEVADVPSARSLFLSLGAKEENNIDCFVLSPFLDKNKILIQLIENPACTGDPFLDISGFSSIGLFVDNIPKHLAQCSAGGFQISEISTIKVQGRWMNIAFVEGKNGELVELISIRREGLI